MLKIKQEEALTQAETEQLYAGLLANDPAPRRYQTLTLTLRTPEHLLVGALLGATTWTWLSIDVLWVEPSFRRRGCGQSMVREAERVALERGCTRARLDTFDFQARSFYERVGYHVYAQLDDFPVGHTQFHLAKSIAPAS
jgi:ribosomal protein S18 acetylase RimI-like enzyme